MLQKNDTHAYTVNEKNKQRNHFRHLKYQVTLYVLFWIEKKNGIAGVTEQIIKI